MANIYYDNSDVGARFQPGETARAGDVDAKFDSVQSGFDGVDTDITRSLKLPTDAGTKEILDTPAQRASKVIGFDANGDMILTAGFSYRGDWTTSTVYYVNDVFRDATSKNLYVVVEQHTSGTLSTDISAGKSVLAINVADVETAKSEAENAQAAAELAEVGAQTSEGNAATSESNASTSESNAASSESAASTSESNSATSETNALISANLAEDWANEPEDIVVAGGEYSAKHYALKAAAFGDPNQFDITADQTVDTRTTAVWMAQLLTNQQNFVAVTATAFVKADGSQPAWTAPTTTTLETASAIVAAVGSTIIEIVAGTSVTLPILSAGTDYTIYAATDGSLQAVDADSTAPAGERKLGGFHASAGASEIVELSMWDLVWRPAAPSPRGMTLDPGGRAWGDIYLIDVEYTNYGYSRNGQQIADGGSLPILPATVGGDGTTLCPSASWWQFLDIIYAAGKRYGIYEELVSLAYGVVERQAVGTDPGTTQHQAGHRGASGMEQATGVMWQWFSGASATAGSAYLDIAEGRGDVFASNIKAPLFGATWVNGSNAGSRASVWDRAPDVSSGSNGARALSDHLNLQADR